MNRRNFLVKCGLVGAAAAVGTSVGTKSNYDKLLCLFKKQIEMNVNAKIDDPTLYYVVRKPGGFRLSAVRKSELLTCKLNADHSDLWSPSSTIPLLKEEMS